MDAPGDPVYPMAEELRELGTAAQVLLEAAEAGYVLMRVNGGDGEVDGEMAERFAGLVEAAGEQGIHGKAAQAFVEKYAEQESLKNVPIPQTFKELDDADYDWRLLKKLIKLYVKSPKAFKDLLVVAHTNGADPNKVRLIRNRKADLLERFEREMREFINKIDTSGVPFKTNIVWQPQLDGEIDDDNPYKVIGWKKPAGK